MCLSVYVCLCLCMSKSISMSMYVFVYLCMYVSMYVYVYVYLYLYMYICMHSINIYLASRSMRYPGVLGSGLRGGPMTNLAAWAQSLCQQWVPSVPSPAAMGSPKTTRPVEGGQCSSVVPIHGNPFTGTLRRCYCNLTVYAEILQLKLSKHFHY